MTQLFWSEESPEVQTNVAVQKGQLDRYLHLLETKKPAICLRNRMGFFKFPDARHDRFDDLHSTTCSITAGSSSILQASVVVLWQRNTLLVCAIIICCSVVLHCIIQKVWLM